MDITDFYGLGSAPIVTGIVELIKQTLPELDSRWWPVVSLAVGVLLNVAIGTGVLARPLPEAILNGVLAGLAASGFYSYIKTFLRS